MAVAKIPDASKSIRDDNSGENMYDPALYLQLVLAEQTDCLRQELPFAFLHDSLLEGLRGVICADLYGSLENDGAAVALLGNEVDRCAGELDTIL